MQSHETSEWFWKTGTGIFAQCRIATNLQFVKDIVSANCDKMSFACVYSWFSLSVGYTSAESKIFGKKSQKSSKSKT